MSKVEIGYICRKGHFQMNDDPEGGSCGTKKVATIYVEPDEDISISPSELAELIEECLASYWAKVEYWRKG